MLIRSFVTLVLLSRPAVAQRTDILTGEPVRPPSVHWRAEPEIFNAPHAPRQTTASDNLPMEIYVTPQVGTGSTYGGGTGSAGPLPRKSVRERPY